MRKLDLLTCSEEDLSFWHAARHSS